MQRARYPWLHFFVLKSMLLECYIFIIIKYFTQRLIIVGTCYQLKKKGATKMFKYKKLMLFQSEALIAYLVLELEAIGF